MFFNDKAVTIDELEDRLAALELKKQEPEKRVVMLESAAGTPYENYFKALAAISSNDGVVALVEEEK
jgi:biopolymer transport protein ExbD